MATSRKPNQEPRPRGWILIAFGLLTAALWVVSGWYSPGIQLGRVHVGVHRGLLVASSSYSVVAAGPRDVPATEFVWAKGADDAVGFQLSFNELPPELASAARMYQVVPAAIPLWPIWLLSLTGGAILNRWDRRAHLLKSGRCRSCGYPLAGLPPGVPCPECGKAAMPKTAS